MDVFLGHGVYPRVVINLNTNWTRQRITLLHVTASVAMDKLLVTVMPVRTQP